MSENVFTQRPLGDNVMLINPGQELQNDNSEEMVEALKSAKSNGYKFAIIDMVDLQYISSSGICSFLYSVQEWRDNGGDIILCNVPASIKGVLELLDLKQYLKIADNEKVAASVCGVKS